MLFTTKEIAKYFNESDGWVYNYVFKLKLEPIKKTETNGINKYKNLYTSAHIQEIENEMIRNKKVKVLEVNYWIFESKGNNKTIEELKKEQWEK